MFKNKKSSRTQSVIFFSVEDNISQYKWMYIVLGIVSLAVIVLGFVVGFSRADNFSVSDLPDRVFVCFIEKEVSPASLFFSRFFSFVLVLVLVWFLSSKSFLIWLDFIILIYQVFLVGLNCSILISLFKLGGVICVILIYLPIKILSICGLLIFISVCFKCFLMQKQTGVCCLSSNFLKTNKFLIILLITFSFVLFLLEAILMPYLSSALFVGIS